MRFLSLFDGIGAASVAWEPLGWECVGVSEIDPFPVAVTKHHRPHVPHLGDITKITEEQIAALGPIDLVVGGFPCQDLSVAGKRAGLRNDNGTYTRSGLFFDAIRLVQWAREHCGCRWLLIENVPGLFSSNGGRDFADVVGTIVGTEFDVPRDGWRNAGVALGPDGLVEWCTLDAQFFDLAQRRVRVFALADFGDWTSRGPVLFERASLSGHPAPSREAGKAAPTIPSRRTAGGGLGTDFDCDGGLIQYLGNAEGGARELPFMTGSSQMRCVNNQTPLVAHSLRADGLDASEDGTGRGTPLVPVAQPYTLAIRGRGETHNLEYRQDGTANALLTPNGGRGGIGVGAIAHAFDARQSDDLQYGDRTGPLDTDGHTMAVAFHENQRAEVSLSDTAGSLKVGGGKPGQGYPSVLTAMQVRRLTPRECCRLQGFPDDYLDIIYRGKPAADGPKYKSLGNSMAVPVMSWLGRRLAAVEAIAQRAQVAA
jgi:DNA (cytosine-5)-methyltransferase 1